MTYIVHQLVYSANKKRLKHSGYDKIPPVFDNWFLTDRVFVNCMVGVNKWREDMIQELNDRFRRVVLREYVVIDGHEMFLSNLKGVAINENDIIRRWVNDPKQYLKIYVSIYLVNNKQRIDDICDNPFQPYHDRLARKEKIRKSHHDKSKRKGVPISETD